MPRAANTTPDTTWTDNELLEEYNRWSPTQRRARFRTKELAITSIANAVAARTRQFPGDTPVHVPRPGRRAGQRRLPQNVKARKAHQLIEILHPQNPYRDEDDSTGRKVSKAFLNYEKMRGGITVLEYLAKFTEQEQKTARQCLWNAEHPKKGPPHIRLVPLPVANAAE